MQKPFMEDEAHGMLIGLAIGDAMGAAAEGRARTDMRGADAMAGGGPHGLGPGGWSGATSMALCLAQMLRSANGWDAEDAMRRFINWRDFGYLACGGRAVGLTAATDAALHGFEATGSPYAVPSGEGGSGGIVLARVAPVVLAYGAVKESAIAVARLQARLTHCDRVSQSGAASLAEVLVTGDRSRLPSPEDPPDTVSQEVRDVLHAVFWSLARGETFEEIVMSVVGLGGAAHLAGAVAGQIAGRFRGYAGIPAEWRGKLSDHDKILVIADDLYAMRPIDL